MVRLVFALTLIACLLLTASASAKSKINITIPASANAGQALTLTGRISGVRKATAIRVENQVASQWQKLASGKSDKRGRFTIAVTLPNTSTATLRLAAKVAGRSVRSRPVQMTLVKSGGNNGSGSGGNGGLLFTPPGKDLIGPEAADWIKPYLLNSTFTDCLAGWPACAVEQRYSYWASGEMYYCRLTGSGSQIINAPFPYQIIGAEVKSDGSWGINVAANAYGNTIYYAWQVSTDGSVNGAYWNSSNSIYDNPNNPTEQISGLQWVRGPRSCDS